MQLNNNHIINIQLTLLSMTKSLVFLIHYSLGEEILSEKNMKCLEKEAALRKEPDKVPTLTIQPYKISLINYTNSS